MDRRSASRALLCLAVVAVAPALPGCFRTGELGHYAFVVDEPQRVFERTDNFLFAEGSEATVTVRRVHNSEKADLDHASTSAPEVLKVEETFHDKVRVRAGKKGKAQLWVWGKDGQSDLIPVEVSSPLSMRFGQPVLRSNDDYTGVVLVGEKVHLEIDSYDADARRLVAPSGLPLKLFPEGRGQIVSPKGDEDIDVLFDSPGEVEIAADFGARLKLEVVRPEDIHDPKVIEILPLLVDRSQAGDAERERRSKRDPGEDKEVELSLEIQVGGKKALLLSTAPTITVSDKSVCEAGSAPPLFGLGTFVVQKKGSGVCTVELTIAGQTVSYSKNFAAAVPHAP